LQPISEYILKKGLPHSFRLRNCLAKIVRFRKFCSRACPASYKKICRGGIAERTSPEDRARSVINEMSNSHGNDIIETEIFLHLKKKNTHESKTYRRPYESIAPAWWEKKEKNT